MQKLKLKYKASLIKDELFGKPILCLNFICSGGYVEYKWKAHKINLFLLKYKLLHVDEGSGKLYVYECSQLLLKHFVKIMTSLIEKYKKKTFCVCRVEL